MITLADAQRLSQHIKQLMANVADLTKKNNVLLERLSESERRRSALESQIAQYRQNQGDVERELNSVLSQLDHLEDTVANKNAAADQSENTEP